jgi:hypothetical protein
MKQQEVSGDRVIHRLTATVLCRQQQATCSASSAGVYKSCRLDADRRLAAELQQQQEVLASHLMVQGVLPGSPSTAASMPAEVQYSTCMPLGNHTRTMRSTKSRSDTNADAPGQRNIQQQELQWCKCITVSAMLCNQGQHAAFILHDQLVTAMVGNHAQHAALDLHDQLATS